MTIIHVRTKHATRYDWNFTGSWTSIVLSNYYETNGQNINWGGNLRMLKSIIKGNDVNKLNIDRVTNKNTGSSYRIYFFTIFTISLLLTTFLNNIDFEKYSISLNNLKAVSYVSTV